MSDNTLTEAQLTLFRRQSEKDAEEISGLCRKIRDLTAERDALKRQLTEGQETGK